MPIEFWLPIAIVTLISFLSLLSLAFLIFKFPMNWMFQQTMKLLEQNHTLTNLAASKDLAAFGNLQAVTSSEQQVQTSPEFLAMDDESAAIRLQEIYAKHGIDPNLALAKDDDPVSDFGGPTAFM